MRFLNYFSFLLIILVSCEKEDKMKPEPVASFVVSTMPSEVDKTITFTNASKNATTYSWDFGDGNFSKDENPTHSYSSAGTFSVSLTAKGEGGENSISKSVTITNSSNTAINPDNTTGKLTDIQGNVYRIVKIGAQWWMAENLKTTKLKDGTDIARLADKTEWSKTSHPAYCWYDNDSTSYAKKYGILYNWYTVETKKLCPSGWHVPTDAEWQTLELFLGLSESQASSFGWRGETKGTMLKASYGWENGGNGTDNYGFSALPGGIRSNNGSFFYVGGTGGWWSSSEDNSGEVYCRDLDYINTLVGRINNHKSRGFSVRCIRD